MLKFLYEKIWKDSVISQLIAKLIDHWVSTLFTTGVLGAGGFLWGYREKATEYFTYITAVLAANPWKIATISLALIIIALILYLILFSKKQRTEISRPQTPLEWLQSVDLTDYRFLFWFPSRRTRTTRDYKIRRSWAIDNDPPLESVPEVHRLIQNGILYYERLSVLEYRIAINDEVYQYLERIIREEIPESERDDRLSQYLHADFEELFFR